MKDLPKILDRVQKLIALSSSSFAEEARTAALMACQLIRENSLVVTARTAGNAPPTPRPSPPPPPRAPREPDLPKPIHIISRFAGVCPGCGHVYKVGEPILWIKGRGGTHYKCREYWSRS